jgi:hypothetical protein
MSTLITYFQCPHCKSVQPKNEIDQMMSGTHFISFGSPVVICSSCGGSIERLSVIQGKYDLKDSCIGQTVEMGGAILIIGLLIWLLTWLFS